MEKAAQRRTYQQLQWTKFCIPTDVEILNHLRNKCGFGTPHVFMNYFVPTLDEGSSAMYPNDLPEIQEGGSYYFHKIVKADSSGENKRKRNQLQWRQSGPPIKISHNGLEIGMKLISVLYEGNKINFHWVRHEYFLTREDQKVGDYVLWKVFFPTKKNVRPNLNPSSPQPHIYNPTFAPSAEPPISNPSSDFVDFGKVGGISGY
ncbi:SUPPRESSOR OF GAMMA RESPONSE 1-like [Silene latifolia]|uniref:SUPPRESSOR OF GAMMA RESPONSE 1-like n=1 Tax=Silene latifolia TaxID=37657 RepID=UPI003D784275